MDTTTRLIALSIDVLALSLVLGATAWFFFVQSPVLFRSMGRDRFVVLQMRLAVLFFHTMTIAVGVMLVGAAVQTGSLWAWPTVTAAFAFVAVCINKLVVLPRALAAGGQSRRRREGHDEVATTLAFGSEGAGLSTKALHRTVVLFVVLMLAGLVAHGVTIVGAATLAEAVRP